MMTFCFPSGVCINADNLADKQLCNLNFLPSDIRKQQNRLDLLFIHSILDLTFKSNKAQPLNLHTPIAYIY